MNETPQVQNDQLIRDALRRLPTHPAPAEAWSAIARRAYVAAPLDGGRSRAWRRYGSIAAAAMLAFGLVAMVRHHIGTDHETHAIAALIVQSQTLERAVAARRGSDVVLRDARAALVYRIADLDRELAPLSVDPTRDPRRAEALWQRRVELLGSLAQLEDPSPRGAATLAF